MRKQIILFYILLLLIFTPLSINSQNTKVVHTQVVDILPSVSEYIVSDVDTNETYYYTRHLFTLKGEFNNLSNQSYTLFGGTTTCDPFHYSVSIRIIEITTTFVTPYYPPAPPQTCGQMMQTKLLEPGTTDAIGSISLFSIGLSSSIQDSSYVFELVAAGISSEIKKQIPITLTIKDGEIDISPKYQSDKSGNTSQTETSVNLKLPVGIFLLISLISTVFTRRKIIQLIDRIKDF